MWVILMKVKKKSKFTSCIKSIFRFIKKLILDVLHFILKLMKYLLIFLILFTIISVLYQKNINTWFELRTANLIEYVLDKEDDVNSYEVVRAAMIAAKRTTIARCMYDDTLKEDAYRHFTWNYEGSKKLGLDTMKIITDNHEIAFKIRKDVYSYLKNQFGFYTSGTLKEKILSPYLTIKDVKKYALEKKEEYLNEITLLDCDISEIVDGYTAMDYINNYYGRLYSRSEDGINESFIDACIRNYICFDTDLADEDYEFVHNYFMMEYEKH